MGVAESEASIEPDADMMLAHIEHVHGRALRGQIQIAWTTDVSGRRALNRMRLFDDMDEAALFAAEQNVNEGCDVYVGASLVRDDVPSPLIDPVTGRERRPGETEMASTWALWADFDGEGDAGRGLDAAIAAGVPPTLVVETGTVPHVRAHLWWALAEGSEDLTEVRSLLQRLGHVVGGDPAIREPARVMRLAGSVSWPKPGKAGRVAELVRLRGAPREVPYTLEELAAAIPRFSPAEPTALDFNTAASDYRADGALDIERLWQGMRRPGEWNTNATRLIAHFVNVGLSNEQIMAMAPVMTIEPSEHSRRLAEIVDIIGRTRRKWEIPDQIPDRTAPTGFVSFVEAARAPPPKWLVDGWLPERGLASLVAGPKVGKTFAAFSLCVAVAAGTPWFDRKTLQTPIAYVAGEGGAYVPIRWLAACAEVGVDPATLPASLWRGAVPMTVPDRFEPFAEACVQAGARLIVLDTLARCFGPGDENNARDMSAFVRACDQLATAVGGAVLVIHHTKRGGEGGRGSTALLGALDSEIRLKKEGRTRTLSAPFMKDAPEPGPIKFGLEPRTIVHPATGEPVHTSVVSPPARPTGSAGYTNVGQEKIHRWLIAHGPADLQKIMTGAKIGEHSARDRLRELQDQGRVVMAKAGNGRFSYTAAEI